MPTSEETIAIANFFGHLSKLQWSVVIVHKKMFNDHRFIAEMPISSYQNILKYGYPQIIIQFSVFINHPSVLGFCDPTLCMSDMLTDLISQNTCIILSYIRSFEDL